MKISFSFENLFPAQTRAGRNMETLVRRFHERGHEVHVITTPVARPQEPDGIRVFRLKEMPGAKGHARSDGLMGKAISRYLKQHEIQVHFAEGVTPLSALTIKAAHRAGLKTIIRVLSDDHGIEHSLGGERKLTPSALKKRVATMLQNVDAAAASSRQCVELLDEIYDGEVRVIEKSVDLHLCNPERVQPEDMQTFREKFGLKERPVIIYSRERIRGETLIEILPLVKALSETYPEVVLVVAGEIDGLADVENAVKDQGLLNAIRLCGPLSQRDLYAACAVAQAYLAPMSSRASAGELLESMALGAALVCFPPKAAAAPNLVAESGALVLAGESPESDAAAVAELLKDADRLAEMQERGRKVAAGRDIGLAVSAVQELCEEVLGLPHEEAAPQGAKESPGDDAEEVPAEVLESVHVDPPEELVEELEVKEGEGFGSGVEEEVEETSEASSRRRRRRSRHRLRHEASEDLTALKPAPRADEGEEDQTDEAADAPVTDEQADEPSEAAKKPAEPSEEELLDAANERFRELGPKLSLSDLLPFLRPPKNVFILSLASGTGQHRAGEALYEAFKSTDQNLRVKQFNIADFMEKKVSAEDIERIVGMDAQGASVAASSPDSESEAPEGGADDLPGLESLFGAHLEKLILEKRPHEVILTHFLPLKAICDIKKEHELKMLISVVVTDYDFNEPWLGDGVNQYLVPNDKVRFKMIRRGVDPKAVDVVGIPVHPRFEGEVDRDKVRRGLGVRPQAPVLLLRPGGLGSNDEVLDAINGMAGLGFPFTMLVLAGKNEALLQALKGLDLPKGVQVRGFGFVPNIHEMMSASDLMITRPVGHTVAEAFAAGVPMVLFRPRSGVEERAADWFVERGVALKARDSLDLEWIVSDLLRNHGRLLKQKREAAVGRGRPRKGAASLSVQKICRELH